MLQLVGLREVLQYSIVGNDGERSRRLDLRRRRKADGIAHTIEDVAGTERRRKT